MNLKCKRFHIWLLLVVQCSCKAFQREADLSGETGDSEDLCTSDELTWRVVAVYFAGMTCGMMLDTKHNASQQTGTGGAKLCTSASVKLVRASEDSSTLADGG